MGQLQQWPAETTMQSFWIACLEWGLKVPTRAIYVFTLKARRVGVIIVRGSGGAPADAGNPLWGNDALTAATARPLFRTFAWLEE